MRRFTARSTHLELDLGRRDLAQEDVEAAGEGEERPELAGLQLLLDDLVAGAGEVALQVGGGRLDVGHERGERLHRRLQRGEVLQQQPGAVLRVARRELAEARQHGIVDGRNDAADRLDRLARESLAPRDLLLHISGTRCVLPRLLVLQRAGY